VGLLPRRRDTAVTPLSVMLLLLLMPSMHSSQSLAASDNDQEWVRCEELGGGRRVGAWEGGSKA